MEKIELIQTIFTIIVIFLILGSFIILFIFFHKNRQLLNQKHIREMESNYQQEILRTQLEIQEQTLHIISQEIHDNIGQVLSLAKLNLGMMDTTKPDTLPQKIEDSKKLVGKAIQDLRDLSKSLNTDYVTDMGLLRSIEYELEMIRKSGAFVADLQVEGHPVPLAAQQELILFRIIQEVINNIIKHAKATRIEVQVQYQPTGFMIRIVDDGKGFDLTPLNAGQNSKFGLGIRNMHNRARLVGAEFSITSTLETGTTVIITLPLLTNTNEHATIPH